MSLPSTNAAMLVKFGPVFAEIFSIMSTFAVSSQKLHKLSERTLQLVTDQNCIECIKNCALYYLEGGIVIFESVAKCQHVE